MVFNYKQTKGDKFPVEVHGKILNLDGAQIEKLIKDHLKRNKAIMGVFDEFDVSPDHLDELTIEITELSGRYAETDETTMSLDVSLFEGGKFIEEKFFIVAHEIVHWLTRVRESRSYFNDIEEIQGFQLSIAYELSVGSDLDTIYNRVFPKIEFHFHDPNEASSFFHNLVRKAKGML